jgi:hypothetical protein
MESLSEAGLGVQVSGVQVSSSRSQSCRFPDTRELGTEARYLIRLLRFRNPFVNWLASCETLTARMPVGDALLAELPAE